MNDLHMSLLTHARQAMNVWGPLMPVYRVLMLAALLICAALPVRAAQWQICDLEVEVRDKQSSRRELQVRVLETRAQAQAECPQPGTALSFRPETQDYQSELPRRQWPKPGSKVKLRFRYLDGYCKDRGPCRISHYSPVLN